MVEENKNLGRTFELATNKDIYANGLSSHEIKNQSS